MPRPQGALSDFVEVTTARDRTPAEAVPLSAL